MVHLSNGALSELAIISENLEMFKPIVNLIMSEHMMNDNIANRDQPIMLIFLPIMLCFSAHKIYLLCSKLFTRMEIALSLLSLFVYKFA